MENKNKLSIQEIRFQVFLGNENQKNRIRVLARQIGYFYLKYIHKIKIPDTNIIVIGFSNIENKEYFYLGEGLNQGIGGTGCYFDLEYFHSKNEEDKKNYILQRLHYIMTKYVMHFNLPVSPLNAAFEQILNCDFYLTISKKYTSKSRQLIFKLKSRFNYENSDYRLGYRLKGKAELNYINICTKEHFFGSEHSELDFYEIMNTPTYLEEKGWIDDRNFEMAWGEERYIFNTDELAIKYLPK